MELGGTMTETEIFKAKLSELGRAAGEVKTMTEAYDKSLAALKTRRDLIESQLFSIKEEHAKFSKSADEYRKEFEEKKTLENRALAKQSLEIKNLADETEKNLYASEQALASAKNKEERASNILAEAEKVKKEIEERRDKAKALLAGI